MNHTFNPSPLNTDNCSICRYSEHQHSSEAICEACPNVGVVEQYKGINAPEMLLCRECIAKEKAREQDFIEYALKYQTPELQNERLETHRMNEALKAASKIDESVTVTTDLFNAKTVAILELKSIIDADPEIENKNYKLAEILADRQKHFSKIIFDKNQELIEAHNSQKAIQSYLNTLANKLHSEEREKLKLQDLNYKPDTTKIAKPKVIKTVGTGMKKESVAEVRKALNELNKELGTDFPEFVIATMMLSKKLSLEGAINKLRLMTKESKSIDRKDDDDTPTPVLA